MSAQSPVCGCGRPIRDNASICHQCTARLRRDLGDVRGLAEEVETTRLRQSRTGGQAIGGGHSSDRPLPFDDRPVLAAEGLRAVCRRWVALVVEQRGAVWPRDVLFDYGPFLLGHVDWLRHRDEAPDLLVDLVGAIGRVRGSIDRRAERVYAGPCGSMDYWPDGHPILCSARCDGEVYGRPTARTATCEKCGAVHDAADRREWLLEAIEGQLAYGAQLSKALSSLGKPVAEATFRKWVERGRLVAHGENQFGQALYRVGDVLDLMAADASRRAELDAKRADVAEKQSRRRAC